jgi:hypothetical protein
MQKYYQNDVYEDEYQFLIVRKEYKEGLIGEVDRVLTNVTVQDLSRDTVHVLAEGEDVLKELDSLISYLQAIRQDIFTEAQGNQSDSEDWDEIPF